MKKLVSMFILIVTVLLVVSSSVMASTFADYRFDASAGTQAIDSSGNNNHGTLIGFNDLSVGYADNPSNPGYTSDGMIRLVKGSPLEYIESAVPAYNFITNSFTIEAITSLHPDPWYWQPLVGHVKDEDGTFVYWGSGYATGTKAAPHWHIDHGGPWASYYDYEDVLTDGNMHHYAITYDATAEEMKMYLDYGLIATVTADLSGAVAADDTGVLFIGSHRGSSSTKVWNGLIDRIRFSDNVVDTADFIPNPNAVPIPGAVWLLGSGLISLMAVRQRKGKK
ncbi:MAG: hypothetical protein J7L46_00530 [Bacteroidales bacterium]|nr:hypothetical protein [Bacteroidales bacterium]